MTNTSQRRFTIQMALVVDPILSSAYSARLCIICHEPLTGHVVKLTCACRESVFCTKCFPQYVDADFTVCPVCQRPMDDRHAFPVIVHVQALEELER